MNNWFINVDVDVERSDNNVLIEIRLVLLKELRVYRRGVFMLNVVRQVVVLTLLVLYVC